MTTRRSDHNPEAKYSITVLNLVDLVVLGRKKKDATTTTDSKWRTHKAALSPPANPLTPSRMLALPPLRIKSNVNLAQSRITCPLSFSLDPLDGP